ncbi:MAG: RusA family crossover junction endodeoxyribonuclease [Clostridia bacterium]|nr:RusA family crossover junction endodeoxyribonuclease [Clostridia bacterium]
MIKTFEILGEPKGKARPKFTTINGHAQAITPKQTVQYENLVKMEYQAQCGAFSFDQDQHVHVLIDCFMGMPKSVSKAKRAAMMDHSLRPMKKPDFDNMGKVICDSLNGIAYHDDAQIVDGRVRKFYSKIPRVVVTLSDQEIDPAKFTVKREE